ncbi:MAG: hypothetical protein JXD22_11680 [Sedimentisphaerales bacterium]|nr:hypothetical protein [Sedimentisphaerales bacterium]
MTDLLKTGSDWLGSMMKTHASQSVVYWRDVNSVTVDATLGRTFYDDVDGNGFAVKSHTTDFIIDTDDLLLNSVKIEPEVGDLIKVTRADRVDVFEVSRLSDSCWNYSDAYAQFFRIHTRLIDTE